MTGLQAPSSSKRRDADSAGPGRTALAVVVTALCALPIYLVLVNVFKSSDDIVAHPLALPLDPSLANIRAVIDRPDNLFWNGLLNSIVVTTLSVLFATVLAAMLAHYLVRTDKRWTTVVASLLLAGMMIPGAVILQPITTVLNKLGLVTTLPGLILVNIGLALPFGVLVFMGFVKSIPVELEQAASLDGAGPIRIFWKIVFPLMRPASASVMIFLAVFVWNDFITPLVIMGPSSGTTVTVGIYRSISEHASDFGSVFAFMFLATIPILLFFLMFQKHFVKGLTGGASK